ncbi:N-acetyl sugar amidotransferase [SAR86 cluster bacterium]|nr:N-acetyl sugar amidotransferase [SAR86 cluster bacterium]
MKYCKTCVLPENYVNIMFDDEGVCSACRVQQEFNLLDDSFWQKRREKFEDIIEEYRSKDQSNYDCIVTVSGGKDSYYQVYVIKELYGLNPLLVTYHGNNYLEEGQQNLDAMREAFGVDHIVIKPGTETLKKLNRLSVDKMGDMNWHAHVGIKVVPMQIAVKYNIPLVIWGNVTWNISGMFSPNDFVEYNKRTVLEHDFRGFTWKDMIEEQEGLQPKDLLWSQFPSDEDISRVGVRGIYIGNFFNWDPNEHAKLMVEKYNFQLAKKPFERTYRTMSNLDDMHENGAHDYLKFIKFGYGRGTDHAAEDIRLGNMTRDEGIEMVRKYDSVKPTTDLERWLEYTGRNAEEFDKTADSYRDHRVWWIKDSSWWKENLWGEASEYGEVYLDKKEQEKYER